MKQVTSEISAIHTGDQEPATRSPSSVLEQLFWLKLTYVTAVNRLKLRRLKRLGLQIGGDCRFSGFPDFGSEPYLISIGRHVRIANKVAFITHDGATFVFREQARYREVIKYGRIIVHDNCVLGYGSILLPGVEVGPNSVVAAGAVVMRTVPPNTLVAGNPARKIMTIDQYAELSLWRTPKYDRKAYKQNKKKELLRLFPYPW